MERKAFRFELKSLTEEGTFTGYAAVFGNKDLGGDIIEPGAFAQTLRHKGGKVVLLDYHDPTRRVGVAYLEEDSKGLRVEKGVINLGKGSGAEMYADLRFYKEHGLPIEMSIGYETVTKDVIDNVRHLKEVALWEVSLVTFAMNPKARVTNVKADEEVVSRLAELEAQNEALSRRVAEVEAKASTAPASAGASETPPAAEPHAEDFTPLVQALKDLRGTLAERS